MNICGSKNDPDPLLQVFKDLASAGVYCVSGTLEKRTGAEDF